MNAIEALQAILHARDKGEDPSLILDESSPLVEAARAAIAAPHPSPSAAEQAEKIRRLQDAIEGECDGLAIDDSQAALILEYVRTGDGAMIAAPSASPAEAPAEMPYGFESGLVQLLNEARCLSKETVGNRELASRIIRYMRMHDHQPVAPAGQAETPKCRFSTGAVNPWSGEKTAGELAGQPAAGVQRRGLSEAQEPKDTVNGRAIVNRASGEEIPADEPAFILRARDVHAVYTLKAYAAQCGETAHALVVMDRVADFERFAAQHPERMKTPDTAIPAKSGRSPAPAVERGVAEEREERA